MYRSSSRNIFSDDEELDPDLILETDIPILRNNKRVIKSPVGRQFESPLYNYGGAKSRARPLKPHEHMPFLSLDVAPEFREQIRARTEPEISPRRHGYLARKNGSKVNRQNGRPSSRPSSRQMQSLLRPQSRAHTPSMRYISPNAAPKKMNHQLKSPFKHAVNKSENVEVGPLLPSEDMKERSALATFHISRLITQQPTPEKRAHVGRLWKGRLKPLKPVQKEGPQIQMCLGVNPKPPMIPTPYYRYTLDQARQFVQREKTVVELPVPPLRPGTGEVSIHQTSAASSVIDVNDIEKEMDSPVDGIIDISSHLDGTAVGDHFDGDGCSEIGQDEVIGQDQIEADQEVNEKTGLSSDEEAELDDEFDVKVRLGTGDNEQTVPRGVTPKHLRIAEITQSERAESRRSSAKSVRFADTPDLLSSGKASADVTSNKIQTPDATEGGIRRQSSSPSILKGPSSTHEKPESPQIPSNKPNDQEHNSLLTEQDAMGETDSSPEIQTTADNSVQKSNIMTSGADNSEERLLRNSVSGGVNVVLQNSSPAAEFHNDGSSPDNSSNHDNQFLTDDANLLQAEVSSEATTVWSDARDPTNGAGNDFQLASMPHNVVDDGFGDGDDSNVGADGDGGQKENRDKSASGCKDASNIATGHPPKPGDDDDDDDRRVPDSGRGTRTPGQARQTPSKGSVQARSGSRETIAGSQRGSSQGRKANKDVGRVGDADGNKKGKKKSANKDSRTAGDLQNERPQVRELNYQEEELHYQQSLANAWTDIVSNGDFSTAPSSFDELNDTLNNVRVEIKRWISLDKLSDVDCSPPLKSPRSMDSLLQEPVNGGIYLTENFSDYNQLRLGLSDDDDIDNYDSEILAPRQAELPSHQATNYQLLLSTYRKNCISKNVGEISLRLTHVAPKRTYHSVINQEAEDEIIVGRLTHENLIVHTARDGSKGTKPISHTRINPSCSTLYKDDSSVASCSRQKKGSNTAIVGETVSDSGLGSELLSKTMSDTATEVDSQLTDRCSDVETDRCFLEIVCDQLPEQVEVVKDKMSNNTKADTLSVVATSKELSRPKTAPHEFKPIAPYPPLCFHINARPPEGHLYYFAYGTDMNPNRLSTYIKRSVESRLWGLLFGFQMIFNKKGLDVDAGSFPNIEFNPFSSVEGCVYLITPQELELLDSFVGYPEHYEHVMLPVWMVNCHDPDNYGIAQHCIPAVTYIAQDKWIQKSDTSLLRHEYSLNQCLKSADLLTPLYQRHLLKMSQG